MPSATPRRVEWTSAARRDLRRFPKDVAAAIVTKIDAFAAGAEADVVKLHGVRPPRWRIRVGNHRALIDLQRDRVVVEGIGDRRDVYKR